MPVYTEIKVEARLEGATDIVPVFHGFIDAKGIEYDERTDGVTLHAFSADDLGSRMPAELICTQFVNRDVDGAGTDGLILTDISGLYVTNANVSSYVLGVGSHTITYEYNLGTRRAKLDNGAWVNLSVGSNTLGNDPDSTAYDFQRVEVYVDDLGLLPSSSSILTSEIVLIASGETLPHVYYENIHARELLTLLYAQIGITDITFDTLNMQTFDGLTRAVSLDVPPNDAGIITAPSAIATNGTDLFIAVGSTIYKRNLTTGLYTTLGTNPSAGTIKRLMYNARNNHLWVYYEATLYVGKARILDLDDNTFSAEIDLTPYPTYDTMWVFSLDLIDYNYTGTSWKYGLVFTKQSGFGGAGVRFIDGVALTDTDLAVSDGWSNQFLFVDGGSIYFKNDSGGGVYGLVQYHVDVSGSWVSDGVIIVDDLINYDNAIYNPTNQRVYFRSNVDGYIYSHDLIDGTLTTHFSSSGTISSFCLDSNGLVYFTSWDGSAGDCYSISGTDAAIIKSNVFKRWGDRPYSKAFQTCCIGTRLYGLLNPLSGTDGSLYFVDSRLDFVIRKAIMTGITVKDAINKTLNAFMLVGILSSTKKAFVYRRGDDNGTPTTTGNTLSITVNEANDLIEITKHIPRADLVRVTNSNMVLSYDGTNWNADVLSDRFTVEIDSDFIPDYIMLDLTYHLFQFFSVERNLYKIFLGGVTLFQYEPMDEVSITFTGNIQKTATGPMYGTEIYPNGMTIEALL